jgi:transcriptional regulator with XRE-family HTH domain
VDRLSEEVSMVVQRVLKDVPLRELAEASGLSYGTVRKWAVGLRTPQPESLRQLAAGLRRRGEQLEELAGELEKAAGKE